jgi:FlaG/FlaF family flagellin (archaellin)
MTGEQNDGEQTASGLDASKLKIVLIVAVIVVPAIAIGVFVIGGEGAVNTGPQVEVETGPFVSGETGSGGEDQTVVVRHSGGDSIDMTEASIHVSIPNQGREATLVNLPVGDRIDLEANVDGMDMFDRGFGGAGGAVTSTEWSEGDELRFRIKYSAGGARLQPGDTVVVRMEDEESGSTVFETEIEAEP